METVSTTSLCHLCLSNDDKIQKKTSNCNSRRNPSSQPIIVVDFFSLAHPTIMQYHNESVCGGRHQKVLNAWKQLLDAFKATGCSLVFVADLNIEEAKIVKFLSRRNEDSRGAAKLYNTIENGEKCPTKVARNTPRSCLQSAFHGLAVMAQSYGQFYYSSIGHEADVEIAHYANRHSAMAVISDDSDFLIFKGWWRLWSATGIVRSNLRLMTIEYNRQYNQILSLSVDQLPLFASLMGNDIITSKAIENYFKYIDPSQPKIRNVAKFIQRDLSQGINFERISDNDIRQIIERIFGRVLDGWEQLMKSSIDSYNTDYAPAVITDPIEAKLAHSTMYRPYVENMGHTQVVIMSYYDLRGADPSTSLPGLLLEWLKRRKGILMNGTKDPANTFTALVKKSFDGKCQAHVETMTYPNCEFFEFS